ncbi:hypothetical protein GGF42_007380 [Coemansia sp. RSA 2424]|nr:hypothetical protein GGF42_007380 [Coemansia sp. RSA 2424]
MLTLPPKPSFPPTESDPLLQSHGGRANDNNNNCSSITLGCCCSPVAAVVELHGSIARDFYAAERNFLSWLRLSLALMMTGAATLVDFNNSGVKSFPDNNAGYLVFFLAVFTLLASLAVLYHTHEQLALLPHHNHCHRLRLGLRSRPRPLRWSAILVASTTFAATGSALVIALVATAFGH